MGLMLDAPLDAAPRHDGRFVIVDQNVVAQAFSGRAEVLLSVQEPAGFGAPLDEFLISGDGERVGAALARLVAGAAVGAPRSKKFELRAVGEPDVRFRACYTAGRRSTSEVALLCHRGSKGKPPAVISSGGRRAAKDEIAQPREGGFVGRARSMPRAVLEPASRFSIR